MNYARGMANDLRELIGLEKDDAFTKEDIGVLQQTINTVYGIQTEYYSESIKDFCYGYMVRFFGEHGAAIKRGNIKVILVNDMFTNENTMTFTFLHEIGHFLLGHLDGDCNYRLFDKQESICHYEIYANEFAREFLRR